MGRSFRGLFQKRRQNKLGNLNVGSHKRNLRERFISARDSLDFGWAQSRLNLPAWLGVGEALEGGLADAVQGGDSGDAPAVALV